MFLVLWTKTYRIDCPSKHILKILLTSIGWYWFNCEIFTIKIQFENVHIRISRPFEYFHVMFIQWPIKSSVVSKILSHNSSSLMKALLCVTHHGPLVRKRKSSKNDSVPSYREHTHKSNVPKTYALITSWWRQTSIRRSMNNTGRVIRDVKLTYAHHYPYISTYIFFKFLFFFLYYQRVIFANFA